MQYPGEHLLPGQIGHFFAVLSLVASLVATIAYYKSAKSPLPAEQQSWKRMGRMAFGLNTFSVIVIFGILLFLISNHYFEYFYVWNHSNRSLDPKYLLSCIWEGQEGGFLLWGLWQGVLGMVLIRTAKNWEPPVMTIMSFAQFAISTMLLGIYFFNVKIGLNPFALVRNQFAGAPIFSDPNYMSFPSMQDGQGLNQLLQNYWMVIHPPVLFLGFASTVVPFAYALAAIWQRRYTEWTKPVMPWALFSALILGTGIMMGAAWAYESLTFGGYWAWDPVENASLVPWLILVAGLHTNLVYNSTGYSQRTTVLFYILTYIFVIYSSFLTKSGILGDSSVHAFATAGLNSQMTIWLAVFTILPLWMYIKRYRQIPAIAREENTWSREFWMFIGSLIFFLSALYIIIATSLPVINKLFHTSFALGEDAEFSYNRVQVWIAILIGILTGAIQFFKYRNSDRRTTVKRLVVPFVVSLAATIAIAVFGPIGFYKYGAGFLAALYIAVFAAIYSIAGNFLYVWQGLNNKWKLAGGSVAHIGFGIMLAGILISSSKKEVLSHNTTDINLPFSKESKESPFENLTLVKTVPTDMGRYIATYTNDTLNSKGNITYFKIQFEGKNKNDGSFTLYPNLIRNTKGAEGFSNNPDSRHFWNRDVFSYISYADQIDRTKDTSSFVPHELDSRDTVFYSKGYMILNGVEHNPSNEKFRYNANDTALVADITVTANDGRKYHAYPVLEVKDGRMVHTADTVFAQNLVINFNKIGEGRKIELGVKESVAILPFVSLKVYLFPYINLLWLGIIIMIIGFIMSIVRRVRLLRPRMNVVR